MNENENNTANIKKPSEENYTNNQHKSLTFFEKYFGLSAIIGIISIATMAFIAVDECRRCFSTQPERPINQEYQKTFWVYGNNVESGYLTEVFTVLDRLGYKKAPNTTDWDLLWAHDYPFRKLYDKLNNLKPHQRVNHFPGCGYITNKVNLATSSLDYIPPAFKLPGDKERLLKYSSEYPDKTFVQKNNFHREITIKNITDIELDVEGTFVQEYVDEPLLVNGHRFDIGIYTMITSVDPLRIYIYNGEALLRFCPVKYYPFDPQILDKYVVGDDYLPTWEIPALNYYYNELGFSMRESLNAYLRSKGQDPSIIWEQIEDAIRTIIIAKESEIADTLQRYKSKRNFFEMMRFDFVIDKNLKIYLLEANMSPNLSSAHFPPNRLLYQQVLYNMLGLVGIGERIVKNTLAFRSKSEEDMLVSDKQLAVFPEKCKSILCQESCMSPECHLCKTCLSPSTRKYLSQAYREHTHKGDCKRIFPPTMTKEEILKGTNLDDYTPENQLQMKWFEGKCLLDSSWC